MNIARFEQHLKSQKLKEIQDTQEYQDCKEFTYQLFKKCENAQIAYHVALMHKPKLVARRFNRLCKLHDDLRYYETRYVKVFGDAWI